MQKEVSKEWKKHNTSVLEKLKPGDRVEFPRGAYSHWAIYKGNGEIVHLAGDEDDVATSNTGHSFSIGGKLFNKASIRIQNFWDVVGESFAKRNNDKDSKEQPLDPQEILTNAISKLGEVGYNLIYSNCEHFVNWCRYGKATSDQVDDLVTKGKVVLGGMAVGALAYMATNESSVEKGKKQKK